MFLGQHSTYNKLCWRLYSLWIYAVKKWQIRVLYVLTPKKVKNENNWRPSLLTIHPKGRRVHLSHVCLYFPFLLGYYLRNSVWLVVFFETATDVLLVLVRLQSYKVVQTCQWPTRHLVTSRFAYGEIQRPTLGKFTSCLKFLYVLRHVSLHVCSYILLLGAEYDKRTRVKVSQILSECIELACIYWRKPSMTIVYNKHG